MDTLERMAARDSARVLAQVEKEIKGMEYKFYVTFKPGSFLQGTHTVFARIYSCPSREEARPGAYQIIYDVYGDTVDAIYESAEAAGIEKWGLPEVPWGVPNFTTTGFSNIARSRLARNISRG